MTKDELSSFPPHCPPPTNTQIRHNSAEMQPLGLAQDDQRLLIAPKQSTQIPLICFNGTVVNEPQKLNFKMFLSFL